MGCKKKNTSRWGYTTQVTTKLSVLKEDTPSRSNYDYSDSGFSDNNLCESFSGTPYVSTSHFDCLVMIWMALITTNIPSNLSQRTLLNRCMGHMVKILCALRNLLSSIILILMTFAGNIILSMLRIFFW